MNSNPYAVPAIVLCAVMLIGIILGLLWVSYAQQPAGGKHARHPAAEPVPFADPADGEQVTGALRADPDWLDEDEPDAGWLASQPDWWDQPPPSGRVEVLPDPVAQIAATSKLTLGVLSRVHDALLGLDVSGAPVILPPGPESGPPLPEFHPAPGVSALAAGEDQDPHETVVLPHAVATWGKTASQLAGELAAQHLNAEVIS